ILKAMNRSHDTASYLALIERVRSARPDIAISGDFIVGFPGESEADFEATLKIVGAVNYAQAYSFKYSPRPGTPAAAMEKQVPAVVMDERLQRLQALLNAQQHQFNRATVGRRTSILLERKGRKPGQLVGKTPWLQSVHLETGAAIGDLIDVELVSAGPNSLAGRVVTPADYPAAEAA
ncbi:MAG: TRAM domain-containing protein, partial [Allosphingosinicella sp.]